MDYYAVLGVAHDATPKQIRSAYRRLALQWHPDKNGSPEAEDRFKEISNAFEVLGDPEGRAKYDIEGLVFNRRGNSSKFRTAEETFRDFFGEQTNEDLEESAFIQTVHPSNIFNLPLFESFLVFDTRSTEDFNDGNIVSSISSLTYIRSI